VLYLRARWYQPQTGRFFSPDPIIPDLRVPQSANGYAYVLGDPINLIDPWGLWPEWDAAESERLVNLILTRYNVEIDTDYMPGMAALPFLTWPGRNLACEDNLWMSEELASVAAALSHMRRFLGTARFDIFVGGHTAVRRVHLASKGAPQIHPLTNPPGQDPLSEYSSLSVVELTTNVFTESPIYSSRRPEAERLHTIMHELFHVYANNQLPSTLVDFAIDAKWMYVRRIMTHFEDRLLLGIIAHRLGMTEHEVVLLLSNRENRGRFGWRIEIQPEGISGVAGDYYGRRNITEDFVESSTEFSLLWLSQYSALAHQAFEDSDRQILNRPDALDWLQNHYDREIDGW
jgi:hypothetical protein